MLFAYPWVNQASEIYSQVGERFVLYCSLFSDITLVSLCSVFDLALVCMTSFANQLLSLGKRDMLIFYYEADNIKMELK